MGKRAELARRKQKIPKPVMVSIGDFHTYEETDGLQDFCYDAADLIPQHVTKEMHQVKEIRHICVAKETNWSAVGEKEIQLIKKRNEITR